MATGDALIKVVPRRSSSRQPLALQLFTRRQSHSAEWGDPVNQTDSPTISQSRLESPRSTRPAVEAGPSRPSVWLTSNHARSRSRALVDERHRFHSF
jgi:hypothetical protein